MEFEWLLKSGLVALILDAVIEALRAIRRRMGGGE